MKTLLSCEFNMDTGCVELRYSDGSMISIDCTAVEEHIVRYGHDYYNVSQFDFKKLMDDSNAIEANLRDYINGFSEDIREIMDNFEIFGVIDRLSRTNLLYLVVQRFAEIDMSDTQIDNLEMGYMFEELIRRFSEQSNETAGEHFTPREVIELMVEVLLDPDMDEIENTDGKVITILDIKAPRLIQFNFSSAGFAA